MSDRSTLDQGRHGRLGAPARRCRTSSSTARRSPRCSRPARPARLDLERRRHRHRRDRQVRDPRRHRRAHAHGDAVRRHRRPRTRSRPAPARRRGAARRRSSTSPCRRTGSGCRTRLALWHEKAGGNCAIDYGFHQIIGEVNDESLKAMDELDRRGHHQLQAVHGLPGRLPVQRRADPAGDADRGRQRRADHDARRERLGDRRAGRSRRWPAARPTPYFHGITRPWQTEQEATHRAIMLADLTGAPLYVVHVSAKQALARIAEARNAGQNVFGETCPQYLYLSLEEQLGAGAHGASRAPSGSARRRCAPAPRGTRTSCGSTCAPATSPRCPPTTARSA